MIRIVLLGSALLGGLLLLHAQSAPLAQTARKPARPANARSFVACPIFRNTERQCWLTKYKGTMYYIDPGTGYRPQLGFRVLVEGTVSPGPPVCGGVQLNPLHVSVLPERAPQCQTILPAGGFDSPPVRNNYGYVKHPGDPPLPQYAPGTVLGPPPPPYADTHYSVYFTFDRAFLPEGTTEVIVEEAAALIKAGHPRHVNVKGYSSNSLLEDGKTLVERKGMAEARARLVPKALNELGVPSEVISIDWTAQPLPGDGVNDADGRKTVIDIEF